MLIARAPVRISFAGGGTDLRSYYEKYGGRVLSSSIDKYFYVFVNLTGSDTVQVTSSDYRTFFRQRRGEPILWDGDLSLPKAFLHEFGLDAGLSLFLASEIPPGTGLGSSSAVAVALAKALSSLRGPALSAGQVAELASRMEIEKLGMPIGKQDHYASSFGGLNLIRFEASGTSVERLALAPDVEQTFERRLMLFYTGAARTAHQILSRQEAATAHGEPKVLAALGRLAAMADEAATCLRRGELDNVGRLLHAAWEEKKKVSGDVTNAKIDRWYNLARDCGALGGKITGAGGGGFLLLYCPEPMQEALTQTLEAEGLTRMEFHFEHSGAVVLMDSIPRLGSFGDAAPSRSVPPAVTVP